MLSSHPSPNTTPRILLISLDFDGCVFNPLYRVSNAKNRLVECNTLLTNHLVNQIKTGNFDRVIFMSASNRQSKKIDDSNLSHNNSESSFTALLQISEAVSQMANTTCTVDKYLLADTYGAKPAGENFSKAVAKEDYDFSHYVWDEYKYSILYGHMHKIASENQDAEITHHVYDDRSDILHSLTIFYHDNRLLMPANVKLVMYCYNGSELHLHHLKQVYKTYYHPEAQGAGVKDSRYSENIIAMAQACGYTMDYLSDSREMEKSKGISGTLTHQQELATFKKNRTLSLADLLFEMDYEATAVHDKLQIIEKYNFLIVLSDLRRQLALVKDHSTNFNEALNTAKDVLHLLRALQGDYVWHRHQELMHFINYYGQPFGTIWSAARTLSNSVYGLFYTPSEVQKQAYKLAEMLKPIMAADVRAAEKMSLYGK